MSVATFAAGFVAGAGCVVLVILGAGRHDMPEPAQRARLRREYRMIRDAGS